MTTSLQSTAKRKPGFVPVEEKLAAIRKSFLDDRGQMPELHMTCPIHGEQVIRYAANKPTPEPVCPVCAEIARAMAERKNRFKVDQGCFMTYAREPLTEEDPDMTFETFEVTPEKQRNVEVCKRFADRFEERLKQGASRSSTGLFLIGKSGCGKSHLASAIWHRLNAQGFSPVYLRASTLFSLYVTSGGLSPSEVTKRLSRVSCLIVDELGRSSCSVFESNQFLGLLDARKKAGLPTVLVSNLEAFDVAGVLGDAFVSRSNKLLYPLTFNWPDFRKSQSIVTADPMDLF